MTHDHAHADPHAPIEADTSSDPDYFDVMVHALQELLVDKGLIGAGEVRAMLEVVDAAEPSRGAALIARAWTDPAFKQRLLANGSAAIEEFGIDNYDGTQLIVIEQTPEVHNLVVCTLCSCYPRPVLGLPPDWYKSRPIGHALSGIPAGCCASSAPTSRRRSRSASTTATPTCAT